MTRSERLSLAQARRIALAAQGFADPRPGAGRGDHAARAARRRPGRHRPDRQRQRPRPAASTCRSSPGSAPTTRRCSTAPATGRPRRLVEYWAHEASLIPPTTWPLLRLPDGAGARATPGAGCSGWPRTTPAWSQAVLAEVRPAGRSPPARLERGPGARPAPRPRPVGLELVAGQERRSSTCSGPARSPRPAGTSQFERRYAALERVLPASTSPRRVDPARDPHDEALPRAGADRGPGPRGRHRAVPARLLPAQARAGPAGAGRAGRRRGAAARRRSRAGSGRPTCTARRGGRAGCTPRRCSARSTRWSGSATAPRRSSASTTGSRSTSRRRCGCTATTCCRSCFGDTLVARVDLKADRAAGVLRVQARRTGSRARPAEAAAALARRAGAAGRVARPGRVAWSWPVASSPALA